MERAELTQTRMALSSILNTQTQLLKAATANGDTAGIAAATAKIESVSQELEALARGGYSPTNPAYAPVQAPASASPRRAAVLQTLKPRTP